MSDFPLIDVCENRHGGNAESVAAFDKVLETLPKRRAEVLEYIRDAGMNGVTVKELAVTMQCHCNAISGRATELKASGLVRDSGLRRDGAAVLVCN